MVKINFKFILSISVMYLGFIMFAFLDEKILDKNNKPCPFPYRSALPFYCSTFYVFCASLILLAKRVSVPKNPIPYFPVSFFMFLSTLSTTLAKGKMDYASLNVLKSAKPIAVMILSIFLYKKKIPTKRIISVIVLCFGLILFGTNGSSSKSGTTTSLGYLYIACALFSEGIYAPLIDKRNSEAGNPYITMLFTHLWNMVIIFITSFSDVISSFKFIAENPVFISQILVMVATGGIAQIALYMVVSLSDGLVLSIATTTRKFFTILISSIFFGHKFTSLQWSGIIIVFAALGFDILGKRKPKQDNEKKE